MASVLWADGLENRGDLGRSILVSDGVVAPSHVDPVVHSVTYVDGTSSMELAVGGRDEDRLLMRVEPGDFDGSATITVTASTITPPQTPWFVPNGEPQDIRIDGTPTAPVTLSFAAGTSHSDDIPVVMRHDPDLGWQPVAVGDRGGTATAQRTEFSSHLTGWIGMPAWLRNLADVARPLFLERTTAPTCAQPGPSWAHLNAPALDVLLSCVTTTSANGQERVELRVKNNRGITQEIAVPSGAAYVDVEDQTEQTRDRVRQLAGGSDVVLLPPGKEMRLGFDQPGADRVVAISPIPSPLALTTELVLRLGELARLGGSKALLPAIATVALCTGNPDTLGVLLTNTLDAVWEFVSGVATCIGELAADELKSVIVAQNIVALEVGRPLSIVESDEAFNALVEDRTKTLRVLGKIAKGFSLGELVRIAVAVWEGVAEQIGRANAETDPAVITLELTGAPAVCRAVVDCRRVTSVDVDGDGRLDQVGIAPLSGQADGEQEWSLRVRTATGQLVEATHGPHTLHGAQPWFGASNIDGVPGAELLLRSTSGPHTRWFTMYTWRDGALRVEKNPAITDNYQDAAWPIDNAFSARVGVTCFRDNGTAYVQQTALTPTGSDYFTNPDAEYQGDVTTWRWADDGWTRDSTLPLTLIASEQRFQEVAGWHCPGLPRD
jgi:hypothetical protein